MSTRVGLVGCGRVVERGYLPALGLLDEVELVAVADPDRARVERLAPGIPAFPSAQALAEHGGVDLAIVATPASRHLADAETLVGRGIPVLVEKPPAHELGAARELASLVPLPWVGLNRRFEPALSVLRARLASGRPPLALELELTIRQRAWAPYTAASEPLLDLGVHLVDLAAWLTGGGVQRARAVSVGAGTVAFELELHEASACLVVSHERAWREVVAVRRADGRLLGSYRAGGLARRVAARMRQGRESLLAVSLAAQLGAVVGVLHGGAPDVRLATARDGLRVMAVLDAVQRSAGEGGTWVVPAIEEDG